MQRYAATGDIPDALLSCHRSDEILPSGTTQSCHLNGSGLDRQIQCSTTVWRLRSEQQAVGAVCPSTAQNSEILKFLSSQCSLSALAMMCQLRLPPTYGGTSAYSARNACIGSIRDALHAGTKQASAATTSSVAATAAKITGSRGWVP